MRIVRRKSLRNTSDIVAGNWPKYAKRTTDAQVSNHHFDMENLSSAPLHTGCHAAEQSQVLPEGHEEHAD